MKFKIVLKLCNKNEMTVIDNGTSFDSIDVTVTSGPNYNAQIISDTLYVDAPEDENWNGIENPNILKTVEDHLCMLYSIVLYCIVQGFANSPRK